MKLYHKDMNYDIRPIVSGYGTITALQSITMAKLCNIIVRPFGFICMSLYDIVMSEYDIAIFNDLLNGNDII